MDKNKEIKRISSIAINKDGKLKTIAEQYSDYLNGRFKPYDFMVAKIDSKGFDYFNIDSNLLIVIRQSVIEKIFRESKINKHGHGDSIDITIVEEVFNHPEKIIYVIKNNYDNYAFIFDIKDKKNNYVLVAMNASKDINRRFEVNDITSIYGKYNLEEYINYCDSNNNYIIKKVNSVN